MKRARLLLPVASGLLYWAALAPLDLGPLGWIALVPLMVFARTEETKKLLLFFSWLGGWVGFSLLYWWVVPNTHWSAPFAVGLYMGLYPMLFALLLRLTRAVPIAVAAPAAWVTCEYLWAYVLGGLPYNLLGYTQHRMLAFIQIADLGGIWLVSAVVAAVNGAIASAALNRPKAEWRWSVGIAAALVVVSAFYGVVRLQTLPLEDGPAVAVVQPNIPQDWREVLKLGEDPEKQRLIWEKHVKLSREAAKLDPKPDLICWPESAIFKFPIYDPLKKSWEIWPLADLTAVSREAGVPILMGVLVYEPAVEGGKYRDNCPKCPATAPKRDDGASQKCPACGTMMRIGSVPANSALLLSPKGEVLGRYDKIRLVAFSERIPLPFVSGIVAKFMGVARVFEFRPGTSTEPLPFPGHPLGVGVCYEAAYPEISRKFAGKGARIHVNVSNEGWFSDSAELDLMLAMARFRAIESRVHYLRATNTGISAFIEPTGEVAGAVESGGKRKLVEGVLSRRVRTTPSGSLYRAMGDVIPWGCVIAVLVGAALGFTRRGQLIDSELGRK